MKSEDNDFYENNAGVQQQYKYQRLECKSNRYQDPSFELISKNKFH